MGVFPFTQTGIEKLELIISNSELQAMTAGSNINLLNAGPNEAGFIPVSGYCQYINASVEFKLSNAAIYITSLNVSKFLVLTYVDPTGSLKVQPNFAFTFFPGYDISAPQWPEPTPYKVLDLSQDGDYIGGDGELRIVMFGNYI